MGTFTVRRKAVKRSERWYQNIGAAFPPSPQAEVLPARKKRRLDEPLSTTTDDADIETAVVTRSVVWKLLHGDEGDEFPIKKPTDEVGSSLWSRGTRIDF
jgi:hypothetical protein